MFEKIHRLARTYYYNYGRKANAIYVGHEEWTEIRKSAEAIQNLQTDTDNSVCKCMGIDLIEVNKTSYLKVGFVE